MAQKAGAPKKKKAKPKLTDKEQSERFKKTARELGVDESGERFESAFRKVVLQKGAATKRSG
jgi:hypothetical protein